MTPWGPSWASGATAADRSNSRMRDWSKHRTALHCPPCRTPPKRPPRRRKPPQHPAPYTLRPTPYTLHPTPYNLHPTPCTLQSSTINPKPSTLNPQPSTLPGYLVHKKLPPPQDHRRVLGTGLLRGPRAAHFFMREVLLKLWLKRLCLVNMTKACVNSHGFWCKIGHFLGVKTISQPE